MCIGGRPAVKYLCIMKNKTALITGANKSLGFETARELAKAGYHVFIGVRDKAKGDEAVAKLNAEGLTKVEVLVIDVANQTSIDHAKAELERKLESLDVLVNNAGILGGMMQSALTVSIDTAKEVYETNLFGPMRVTQAFIELLKKIG